MDVYMGLNRFLLVELITALLTIAFGISAHFFFVPYGTKEGIFHYKAEEK